MLSEYDTDKDGFISLREFLGDIRGDGATTQMLLRSHVYACGTFFELLFLFLLEESPSQWEIEETVRFKDLYDQDKDGKLNREEQLRWVAPNSYGSAREEVNQLH